MWLPCRAGWMVACVIALSTIAQATVVADALLSFPAQTDYFEYDDLAALRRLPEYNSLRSNFSGRTLEEAKEVLGRLGIREDQVDEVVTGSAAKTFYGLVAGSFSSGAVTKNKKYNGYAAKLLDSEVYCAGRDTCIVFLDNSLAAFGPVAKLQSILEVRDGHRLGLGAKREAVQLLNSTDARAPVRGMLFGGQLQGALASLLPEWGGSKTELARFTSTVSGVGYSVAFDSEAHVNATLECTSGTGAAMLAQMLNALGTLQKLTASVAGGGSSGPLRQVHASSSGNMVQFHADSAIPALIAAGH